MKAALVIASCTVLSATAAFRQPPKSDAQVARDLADQKAEVQVGDAIKEADKLAKASALKAITRLKQEQLGLDLAATLSSGKRTELTKTIQAKIDALKGAPNATPDEAATTDAK